MRPAGVLFLFWSSLVAASTPALDVAALLEGDPAAVGAGLTAGTPIRRRAAARVALVRRLPLESELRAALATESDAIAAREQLRALALLGADVTALLAEAKRFPAAIDADVALAVARGGSKAAIDLFANHRTELRVAPSWDEFFTLALWNHPLNLPLAASRVLGTGDANGWSAITDVARDAHIVVPPSILGVALSSQSEDIRTSTVWYLVRGYAPDPTRLPLELKASIEQPAESMSDREAFGREIVRRMLGAERLENPRWVAWLNTKEADALLSDDQDVAAYLSDVEFAVREKRCRLLAAMQCPIPKDRRRTAPAAPVALPAYQLPSDVPAGIADEVVRSERCAGSWLSVASATVDRAGRVQSIQFEEPAATDRNCRRAYETIARLSLAAPLTIATPLTTGSLLFVNSGKALCLDEDPPSEKLQRAVARPGGEVRPPVVKRRVEPQIPRSAWAKVDRHGGGAKVIIESVIGKTGCVRSIRLIGQSPVPEVNRAVLFAVSKWQFAPGMLNGEPVNVVFSLTTTFFRN